MRLQRWLWIAPVLCVAACLPTDDLPMDDLAAEEVGQEVDAELAARVAQTEFDAGFRTFQSLCAKGDLEEAESLAEVLRLRADQDQRTDWLENMAGSEKARLARRLMGGLGLGDAPRAPLGDDERAVLIRWTLGVARAESGAVQEAELDFEAVRAGGHGELRLDGMYGLGWLGLSLAEILYESIPEVTGASLDPMSPGFQPQAAGGEDEPDPLELAKKAFELSLEHFLERLALDWRDADTRANVELIQRRLRRIEEIEDKRKQEEGTDRSQEDPEEQDKQEDDSQESSGEQGAPSDEEQDEDSDPKESENSDEEQEGSEEDSEEENDDEAGEQDEDSGDEQDAETQEVFLTEEEMKRLLETTQQHNQEGEEMRAKMKSKGRVPTERDW
ncbi:MAG: hypothetical protein ACI8QC_001521 [Planctomycetota bacterium]|jgi:hypothetical protein